MSFFLEKIDKIRADLDLFEEYEPSVVETVFELSSFASVSEFDVRHVLSKLETKNCEMDIIQLCKLFRHIYTCIDTHSKLIIEVWQV